MCRHLAYLGSPTTLQALLVDPPHGLYEQAWAPRRQRHGRLNADGFGVGFYVPGRAEPVRYRRAQPMWTDASFASLVPVLTSGCVLAAVRSATVGSPVDEASAAPFAAGPWLFSHNGRVDGFTAGAGAKLRARLGPDPLVESAVDSALLWALALAALLDGADLGSALASVVAAVREVTTGGVNLLATDGRTIAATGWGESLFVRTDRDRVVVASEPFGDEDGWTAVPDATVLTADVAHGVRIGAL